MCLNMRKIYKILFLYADSCDVFLKKYDKKSLEFKRGNNEYLFYFRSLGYFKS